MNPRQRPTVYARYPTSRKLHGTGAPSLGCMRWGAWNKGAIVIMHILGKELEGIDDLRKGPLQLGEVCRVRALRLSRNTELEGHLVLHIC